MLWACEVSLTVAKDDNRKYKPEGYTHSVMRELESDAETCDEFFFRLYHWGVAGLQLMDGHVIATKPLIFTVYQVQTQSKVAVVSLKSV